MYGFDYFYANNEVGLNNGLAALYNQNSKPFIVEIVTPTAVNDTVLLRYFKELR